MIYAVIDTNVFVAALLSRHSNSATVLVVDTLLNHGICPLYNQEIINEYQDVLHRDKFHIYLNNTIRTMRSEPLTKPYKEENELVSDTNQLKMHTADGKDVVFYEVALSKDDAYLVTGNKKHFPQTPIVVTPAEMLEILQSL